jgi:hypothetical protein
VAVAHYATTIGIDVDGQTPEQVQAGGWMVRLGLRAKPAGPRHGPLPAPRPAATMPPHPRTGHEPRR